MTKTVLSKSMRKLSLNDRIELIDELWHSVAADQADVPVPNWQKQMIEENIAQIEANLSQGVPLVVFRRELHHTIRRMEAQDRKRRQ